MTFRDKLLRLVNDLIAGTAQGTFKWTETADEDSFRAVLSAGIVRIERGSLGPTMGSDDKVAWRRSSFPIEGSEYSLLVLDERNKELARYVPDQPESAEMLHNLWKLAGRAARNADQKIDSLLQEVENRVKVQ
jgi:hypothetical protein